MSSPQIDGRQPDRTLSQSAGGGDATEKTTSQHAAISGGRKYKPNYLARAGLLLFSSIFCIYSIPALLANPRLRATFAEVWRGKKIEQRSQDTLSAEGVKTDRIATATIAMPQFTDEQLCEHAFQLLRRTLEETDINKNKVTTQFLNTLKQVSSKRVILQAALSHLKSTVPPRFFTSEGQVTKMMFRLLTHFKQHPRLGNHPQAQRLASLANEIALGMIILPPVSLDTDLV